MIKNYGYYLVPGALRAFTGILVVVPLTTWYLDPADFGLYAIISAVTAFIPALTSVGAAWVLAANTFRQKPQEHADLILTLVLSGLGFAGAVAFLFAGLSDIVLRFLFGDVTAQTRVYYVLSLLTVMLGSLWPIASSYLSLRRQAASHARVEIVSLFAAVLATTVSLVILQQSVMALFLGPLASAVVFAAAALWFLRGEIFRGQVRREHFSEILRMGLPSNGVMLCETALTSGLRYAMGKLLGLAPLGLYAHSESYKSMFVMVSRAFNMVYAPEALRVFAGKQAPGSLNPLAWSFGMLLGAGGVMLSLFAADMVNLLTHGKFTAAAPLVVLWYLLAISHAYGNGYTQYLLSLRQSRFLSLSAAGLSLTWLLLGIPLVYLLGTLGAVLAVVLSNISIQAVRHRRARRLDAPALAEAPVWRAMFMTMAALPFGFMLNLSIEWRLAVAAMFLASFVVVFRPGEIRRMWRGADAPKMHTG